MRLVRVPSGLTTVFPEVYRPYFLLSDSAKEEFSEYASVKDDSEVQHTEYDSVVVGLAPDLFDYAHLTKAFRILLFCRHIHQSGWTPLPRRADYALHPEGDVWYVFDRS